jgi:ribose/xylose/arabinose/galactoside ABC-type transport system permease subunit
MPVSAHSVHQPDRSTIARAVLGDFAAVVLFVVIGRNNHDEGNALSGIVRVAAPFLLALGLGWLLAMKLDHRPFSLRFGAIVWATTLVAGMALRRTVFSRGTALPFVIVATCFLGLSLLGWRLVVRLNARRTVSES